MLCKYHLQACDLSFNFAYDASVEQTFIILIEYSVSGSLFFKYKTVRNKVIIPLQTGVVSKLKWNNFK